MLTVSILALRSFAIAKFNASRLVPAMDQPLCTYPLRRIIAISQLFAAVSCMAASKPESPKGIIFRPIISSIIDDILTFAPEAMLLMVTNPVDVLTYLAWKRTGWSRARVFGLSGVLDAARMASFVAQETGLSVKDISTMVLGGHGDAMVPMPRYACINGIPIAHFLNADAIARIVERTRNAGTEILDLKKSSSAYNSPAAAIATMVDAVSYNRKRILPCVCILDGEYGQRDIAMGAPGVLGEGGLEKVIELPLTKDEAAQLQQSAGQIHSDLGRLADH